MCGNEGVRETRVNMDAKNRESVKPGRKSYELDEETALLACVRN